MKVATPISDRATIGLMSDRACFLDDDWVSLMAAGDEVCVPRSFWEALCVLGDAVRGELRQLGRDRSTERTLLTLLAAEDCTFVSALLRPGCWLVARTGARLAAGAAWAWQIDLHAMQAEAVAIAHLSAGARFRVAPGRATLEIPGEVVRVEPGAATGREATLEAALRGSWRYCATWWPGREPIDSSGTAVPAGLLVPRALGSRRRLELLVDDSGTRRALRLGPDLALLMSAERSSPARREGEPLFGRAPVDAAPWIEPLAALLVPGLREAARRTEGQPCVELAFRDDAHFVQVARFPAEEPASGPPRFVLNFDHAVDEEALRSRVDRAAAAGFEVLQARHAGTGAGWATLGVACRRSVWDAAADITRALALFDLDHRWPESVQWSDLEGHSPSLFDGRTARLAEAHAG